MNNANDLRDIMSTENKLNYVRKELNLDNNIVSVNTGSWGPLCKASRDAISLGYEQEGIARGDNLNKMHEFYGLKRYTNEINEAKSTIGDLLNCSPDEVALCESTTTGMNIFLWGYDWKPGDEIIGGSLENPAASVPLMVLAKRRRLTLKYANLENGYVDHEEAFKEVITTKTRMILISDVNFATGARADLKNVSKIAHENDILVIVDGVQATGNYLIDVKDLGADGYAMARHKFLFGPDGAGALYVNKEVFPKILPTYSGVFTDSEHGMSGKLVLMETAQRYEVSTRPIPIIMGGTAAIKWLKDEVGWDFIYRKSRENFNILWDAINDIKGVQLLTGRDQNGLLTFAIDGIEPINIVNQLKEKNIFTRTIIVTKPQAVRISIGVWNRESDLHTIAQSIETIAKKA